MAQESKSWPIGGMLRQLGPGMLVTGAFIGTGTITTSIVAGTNNGYTLLWASVTLAVIMVMVLQEMVARLSLATGQPLGQLIRDKIGLWASIIAVLAITGGNTIYSVGNLAGVNLSLDGLVPGVSGTLWMAVVTLIYWILLMLGRYALLEKTIMLLVGVMSLTFLFNMFYVTPDYPAVIKGLITPRFELSNTMLVLGLIGTTVVPYNLYLHSSGVIERQWHRDPQHYFRLMRFDTFVPIFLGGIVTMSVGVVAAAVLHPLHESQGLEISSAREMAMSLEPFLGPAAYTFFRIGLFAAAVSCMPMAALSAAYVFTQSFKLSTDLKSTPFRLVFSFVAWVPLLLALSIERPVWTIILAQTVNGMLLPISAVLILYLINKKGMVGDQYRNGWITNTLGGIAVLFAIYMGVTNILSSLGLV